jgi:hypothetical protein
MTPFRIVALVIGCFIAATLLWIFSRPIVVLSADSSLWTTEYDASRQKTIYPGPANPKAELKQGDTIRIVSVKYGKDYKAAFIVAPDWQHGWILTTQEGVSQ